jgi:DNA-nicking Smr family endonuclease
VPAKPPPTDPWKEKLAALKKQVPANRPKAATHATPAQPKPQPGPAPEAPRVTFDESLLDDDRLFERHMLGVERLGGADLVAAEPPQPEALARSRPHDDDAVMQHLLRLVEGEEPFLFAETDEYIEAAVRSLDPRVVRRLRHGHFAVEARLDLHGMTAAQARPEMDRFVLEAVRAGRRVVLVVHGRGLHSKDHLPVLKERLKAWLTRSALALHVLAFVSAIPSDGGVGALYVLLRKDKTRGDRPRMERE